jgi:hypothetical protein
MKVEDALRLLFPLAALVGSLAQVLTQVRARFTWKRQAYAEVGDLGGWYRAIIVVPLYVVSVSLVGIFLASLLAVGVGACLATGFAVPAPLTRLFTLSPLLLVAYAVLGALVFLDAIPEAILAISKVFNAIRFKVGWVNAKWQLRHHRPFFAMNLDSERTERLAHQIFADVRAKQPATLPYQAPSPEGLDRDALANYLLTGCAIESRLKQLPHQTRPRLDTTWAALAKVACEPSQPFSPNSIVRLAATARGVYASLRGNVPGAELPESALIEDSVNLICRQLATRFNGQGSRLAGGRLLWKNGAADLLLRRLARFDRYRESESIRRLFLKLSVRMGVWPQMTPGPFLYPLNLGIASLLLNSRALVAPAETKVIERSEEFSAIVAEGEDHVVAVIQRMLLTTADEPTTRTLTDRVFGTAPRDTNRWALSDYIDLWMFGHTKDFCARRAGVTSGASLGCPLKVDTNACYCDLGPARWKPDEGKLVFDKDA